MCVLKVLLSAELLWISACRIGMCKEKPRLNSRSYKNISSPFLMDCQEMFIISITMRGTSVWKARLLPHRSPHEVLRQSAFRRFARSPVQGRVIIVAPLSSFSSSGGAKMALQWARNKASVWPAEDWSSRWTGQTDR